MRTNGPKKNNRIKLLNLTDYNQNGEFYFRTGLKYSDKSQFVAATRYLKKAVEMDPENAEYQFNLACFYSQLRELKKSSDILNHILEHLNPAMTECLFALACNCFDEGNLEQAAEYFRMYIAVDAEGQFAHECLDALEYINEIKLEDGKNELNSAKYIDEAHRLVKRKFYFGAIKKLEMALTVNPNDNRTKEELYLLYIQTGFLKRALKFVRNEYWSDEISSLSKLIILVIYNELGMAQEFSKKCLHLLENKYFELESFDLAIKKIGKQDFHLYIRNLMFACLKIKLHPKFYMLLFISLYNTGAMADIINLKDACIKRFPELSTSINNIMARINDGNNHLSDHKLSYDILSPKLIKVVRINKKNHGNNPDKICKKQKRHNVFDMNGLKNMKNEENE